MSAASRHRGRYLACFWLGWAFLASTPRLLVPIDSGQSSDMRMLGGVLCLALLAALVWLVHGVIRLKRVPILVTASLLALAGLRLAAHVPSAWGSFSPLFQLVVSILVLLHFLLAWYLTRPSMRASWS